MFPVYQKTVRISLNCVEVAKSVRYYARWSHRRPLQVLAPEEYEKNGTSLTESENIFQKYSAYKTNVENKTQDENGGDTVKYKIKSQRPLVASYQKNKVTPSTDMLQTIIDQDGNFVYTKMKDNDARIGKVLTDIKTKKDKGLKDLILLEGWRLIKDALLAKCTLKYILFSRKSDMEYLTPLLPKMGAEIYKMPYREIQMWSDLTTTPGIMGLFKMPNVENFVPQESLPITVICDNIREPGNLGAILRTSAAAGCDRVILTSGCTNLWDTKVLRSAIGAHFKLKINANVDWDKIEDFLPIDSNYFVADNKLLIDNDNDANDIAQILEQIPVVPYYSVHYSSKNLVLIVGGETVGISKESYVLTLKNQGTRLNIPLNKNVDSLNVGAALSVVIFEMKKQLLTK